MQGRIIITRIQRRKTENRTRENAMNVINVRKVHAETTHTGHELKLLGVVFIDAQQLRHKEILIN